MAAAAVIAHRSGSVYVAAASRVLAIVYVGSMLLWLTGEGVWRYALLELFPLAYFYRQWSAPNAQHRQFHFLLMCCYLALVAFYTYRLAIQAFAPDAIAMSTWWYQLFDNVVFVAELLLIIGYALLFRRARADRKKYYEDVDGWFARAGAVKRSLGDFLRHGLWQKKKQ